MQLNMIYASLCALLGLLLAKLKHYFNIFIHTNMSFWLFKVKRNIGDTASLNQSEIVSECSMLINFFDSTLKSKMALIARGLSE